MKNIYIAPQMNLEKVILEDVMMFSGSNILPEGTGQEGDVVELQKRIWDISESLDLESNMEEMLW
ncbi:MAG: hypothetical protein IKD25_05215 [Bacteroidaceae bacterium]|nr:hypothetical protein [Bacteroidaceae bacterium]